MLLSVCSKERVKGEGRKRRDVCAGRQAFSFQKDRKDEIKEKSGKKFPRLLLF